MPWDLVQRAHQHLAIPRQVAPLHRLAESLSQISVRLEADPGILSWGAQELRRPPHSGADFQDLGAQEGLDMAAKIRLPDGRRGEQLEFGANVRIMSHWAINPANDELPERNKRSRDKEGRPIPGGRRG